MSTRSTIWIKENSEYKGIYCHSDGYLENNGAILLKEYTEKEKVTKLIELGSLSSLGKFIDPINNRVKHDFDNRQDNTCVFYNRDRGDKLEPYKAKKVNISGYFEEYNYIFIDNNWFYTKTTLEDLKPLTTKSILESWNGNGYAYKDFIVSIFRDNFNKIIETI